MDKQKKYYIEKLGTYFSNLNYNDIPEEVLQKAKIKLLDYLFVYHTAYFKSTLKSAIIEYVKDRVKHNDSTILLADFKADIELTTFASSLIAHSVELDDGHRYGTAHPAVVVIPAAMAMAEKQNASFADLLKAIVVGYEIMLRLSAAINPSHLKRGFHSTSTTGTLGSAAASASILKYDNEMFVNSLSIAGLLSSGLQEMLHGNPSIKAFQVGRSCQSGVLAAQFAKLGGKGPASLLEGQHGWIKAMADEFDENKLIGDLGKRWEILNTYTKLYPTCRHCHHAIDLAIDAYKHGIHFDKIKKVSIHTYSLGIAEVGIIKKPTNIEDAMFSITYAVSISLKNGFVTYEDLENYLLSDKIQKFSNNIETIVDKEMDDKYPLERGCKLLIETKQGEKIALNTKLPKGEPETDLNVDDFKEKFFKINQSHYSFEKINTLFDKVYNFEPENDVAVLFKNFFN
jgi:2-methylcitrate dehydratase PrpD